MHLLLHLCHFGQSDTERSYRLSAPHSCQHPVVYDLLLALRLLLRVRTYGTGGALYALCPEVITGRRSRLAYGVECVGPFRSGHREELRIMAGSSRTALCAKLFKSMVKMDELVEHDQVSF